MSVFWPFAERKFWIFPGERTSSAEKCSTKTSDPKAFRRPSCFANVIGNRNVLLRGEVIKEAESFAKICRSVSSRFVLTLGL